MPAAPDLHQLDGRALAELYDEGSLRRGRAYAAEGRVAIVSLKRGEIEAVCRGSGRQPYVVQVTWFGRGQGISLDDACSCPLGGACKHCVAAILTAQRQEAQAGRDRAGRAGGGPPAAGWRRLLADLELDEVRAVRPAEGLALQVSMAWPMPSPHRIDTGPQVTLRPMRRGKKGAWVKTGASWNDIGSSYGPQLGDVAPLQRSALQALLASSRSSYYGSTGTVSLDQFGPDLWYHLRRALEAGVELIAEFPPATVELVDAVARPVIDLTTDADGDVLVTTGFVLEDEPMVVDGEDGGLLGAPPHGLWSVDGMQLRLVPLEEPLHPAIARLADPGQLVVPAEDVDELLDRYQPALARHAATGSSDGSVTIAANRFEGLTLVVERPAPEVALVEWSARYRRGERVTHHRLRGPSGRARDGAAEGAALADLDLPLHLLPGLADAAGAPVDGRFVGTDAITLLTAAVPWLAERGVEVEVRSDFPSLRAATEEPRISIAVADAGAGEAREGNDWFDLGVEVSVDGEVVDFVTLFTALNQGQDTLVLPSGTWLGLDRPEFAKLRDLIAEAQGLADPSAAGVVRINPFQVSWWDELVELGVVAQQSERWAANVARMGALAAPAPVAVPAGLNATLRPYQQEGLEWLAFLHGNGLGGILADDMGLGKTVQTLALALHVLEAKPDARFLVVAPTSVVENWAREAARFAPGVTVRTVGETQARRGTSLADEIEGATLVVTSYALFRLEFEQYAAVHWELLLLDEAQFVKNHQGKTHQCVRRLPAATKIALTGTPLENSLMDLWSLLSIAAPGLFPDPKRFAATYRKPIESGQAPELLATLRRRIAPLLRRRTKGEVLTELPLKTEQTIELELSARHARIYQTQLQRQRQKVLGLVGDVQKHRFEILRSLTILRQLALDPALVDEAHDGVGSAKLDRLIEDLTQVIAEGHRALVFSQFTRFLGRVRTRLDAAGIDHAYLDGRTRKREEAISRFKDGDAPVFVISLKAGGFGLNLTEADYCFVLDPWWNPATENQAIDRTHRMGQVNPVVAYRYVSVGTIEEKVMELKAGKAALFDRVLDGEGALAGALTEDDIRGLLDLG